MITKSSDFDPHFPQEFNGSHAEFDKLLPVFFQNRNLEVIQQKPVDGVYLYNAHYKGRLSLKIHAKEVGRSAHAHIHCEITIDFRDDTCLDLWNQAWLDFAEHGWVGANTGSRYIDHFAFKGDCSTLFGVLRVAMGSVSDQVKITPKFDPVPTLLEAEITGWPHKGSGQIRAIPTPKMPLGAIYVDMNINYFNVYFFDMWQRILRQVYDLGFIYESEVEEQSDGNTPQDIALSRVLYDATLPDYGIDQVFQSKPVDNKKPAKTKNRGGRPAHTEYDQAYQIFANGRWGKVARQEAYESYLRQSNLSHSKAIKKAFNTAMLGRKKDDPRWTGN